jgi:hypothetical protein
VTISQLRGGVEGVWTPRVNPNVRTEVVAQLAGLPATRIPLGPHMDGLVSDEEAAIQQLGTYRETKEQSMTSV